MVSGTNTPWRIVKASSTKFTMRKEHQKPAKVRPSLADRFMLAVSFSRAVDGGLDRILQSAGVFATR
jgi:hypothetical protein